MDSKLMMMISSLTCTHFYLYFIFFIGYVSSSLVGDTWTWKSSELSSHFLEVLYEVFSLPGSRPSSLLTSWKSSASLKMDLPELPSRLFTVGEEPAAIRSISYHSDDKKLFKALCDSLTAEEYEDLKASKDENAIGKEAPPPPLPRFQVSHEAIFFIVDGACLFH
ncbi:hypothetical protein Bca4012_038777 [Brassica carinata]